MKHRARGVLVLVLIGLGLMTRLIFLWHQPFTNDEGAYLYDARTLAAGEVPGGDVLTKTPVVILVFAATTALTGNALDAARYINVIAQLLTILPLVGIGQYLVGQRQRAIPAAIWLLAPATVVLMSVGHTQSITNLILASAVWVCSVRCTPRAGQPSPVPS